MSSFAAVSNEIEFAGRTILIVDDDRFSAREMADAVSEAGGAPLGPVASMEEALTVIETAAVDAVIIDIRTGDGTFAHSPDAVRSAGVSVLFVTGCDDWFLSDEADDSPFGH